MRVISSPGGRRVARPAFGSMAVALLAALLLLATAMPALGAAARKLSDPVVTPRTGTTATTIVFEVTYSRPMKPEFVRVRVGGANHAMTLQTAGEWSGEGRFRWAGKLPAGTHAVLFQGAGVEDLDAGTVTITVPPTPTPRPTATPKPKPTPTPTPKPAATPTPRPAATPTPKPAATPVTAATPTPTAPPSAATPTPTPTPSPDPSPTPTGTPGAGSGATPSTAPGSPEPSQTASPTPEPSPSDDVVTGALPGGPVRPPGVDGSGGSVPIDPAGGALGDRWSPEAAMLATLGLDGLRLPPMGLVPTLVTTTGVATMAMAFSLFGKRRRGEADDETLPERAAQGVSVLDAPFEEAVAAALAAAPEVPDVEAGMPRWRRPSLLQARKADPIRDGLEAPRLTFDNGLIGPIDGRERRVIKYNVVTLLDEPDELRANGIGVLTQGDEIQLLEKRGVYWHVLCPDGTQGWVHKMTVGELVSEPRVAEGPRATMPTVAESWTLAEDGIDDDVLSAYLAARRRGD